MVSAALSAAEAAGASASARKAETSPIRSSSGRVTTSPSSSPARGIGIASPYLRQSAAPTGPPVVREACKARVATWSSAPANIPAKSAIRASRGAALGDMVRKAGDDDAGKTGHGAAPGSVRLGGRRATISYSVTVTPDFLGQCAGTAFPL